MNKIQVRCVRGFGVIGKQYNIEVLSPLSGFGYSKKSYCCSGCGELFVLDLENPSLKGSKELPSNLNATCPKCNILLKGHLFPYPAYVFLNGSVETMDVSTISYERDSSSIHEFWLIEEKK
jgi:DNA-directed RNA polymerase subunit RPC12/RpoP